MGAFHSGRQGEAEGGRETNWKHCVTLCRLNKIYIQHSQLSNSFYATRHQILKLENGNSFAWIEFDHHFSLPLCWFRPIVRAHLVTSNQSTVRSIEGVRISRIQKWEFYHSMGRDIVVRPRELEIRNNIRSSVFNSYYSHRHIQIIKIHRVLIKLDKHRIRTRCIVWYRLFIVY